MRQTYALNYTAFRLLTAHGTKTKNTESGTLAVSRKSMVDTFPGACEGDHYDAAIAFLRAAFPNHLVMWGGLADDWFGVLFYEEGV